MTVRERLLHAAAELIAEKGWGAVSTRVLAERAGVGPGVVHYHFDSVRSVLVQASVGALRAALAGLPAVLEDAATPQDALTTLLGALDGHSGRELFTETLLAATRDDEVRAAVREVLADFRAELASWLAARGVPTPGETAAVLAAAVDGVLLHRALSPDLTSDLVAQVLGRVLR
ncbi:TetR/AcrR family transcriptional regulator [Saccharothrix syringae]|uniref:TetR family transcriptional regulator n=1 Tax=Saccharothrix syringae TaxID=103733 RepID=A0A5Q0H193_SACSY|nr:TetR family transcriptional regulator [Saccharothrix syringae]QFZ20031.1 TetR family transcriptional regulator [Saccharothrix syringae]